MSALLFLAQAADPLTAAQAMPKAEHGCAIDPDSTDITVCGPRRADRFRVPFVVHDPGDPRHEGVPAERRRLPARTTPITELSPFLVGGGMAGVSMSTSGDGSTSVKGLRRMVP